MTHAARSIYVFSFWVFACGLALGLAPQPLLGLMAIDASADLLARLFGMVLLFLGFYYFRAARAPGMTEFYRWTTYTRPLAFVAGVGFVAAGRAAPSLLGFVVVDLAGAVWTWYALKRDGGSQVADRKSQSPPL
jgi:hypothetical protein